LSYCFIWLGVPGDAFLLVPISPERRMANSPLVWPNWTRRESKVENRYAVNGKEACGLGDPRHRSWLRRILYDPKTCENHDWRCCLLYVSGPNAQSSTGAFKLFAGHNIRFATISLLENTHATDKTICLFLTAPMLQ
jgi:hypothetical protein